MKKIACMIAGILTAINTFGQANLVINPSFETYTACPAGGNSFIYFAPPWDSFIDSPDYFHKCAGNTAYGAPLNSGGYQVPATGLAYAGFGAFLKGGFSREVIGAPLSATMAIGTRYYVSAKFSLAEMDAYTKNFIPCDKVGIRFSTVPFNNTNQPAINNFAHVYATSIISDTLNWTTVSGSFIADSAYSYLMIGNFYDDYNTDTIKRPGGVISYFFVDDVCVSTSSLTCPAAMITAVDEQEETLLFTISPNPAGSHVALTTTGFQERTFVRIITLTGTEVYRNEFSDALDVDLERFAEGMYFVHLQQGNRQVVKKLIIDR